MIWLRSTCWSFFFRCKQLRRSGTDMRSTWKTSRCLFHLVILWKGSTKGCNNWDTSWMPSQNSFLLSELLNNPVTPRWNTRGSRLRSPSRRRSWRTSTLWSASGSWSATTSPPSWRQPRIENLFENWEFFLSWRQPRIEIWEFMEKPSKWNIETWRSSSQASQRECRNVNSEMFRLKVTAILSLIIISSSLSLSSFSSSSSLVLAISHNVHAPHLSIFRRLGPFTLFGEIPGSL